jgi:8-oxo-dGTP diphosphatase
VSAVATKPAQRLERHAICDLGHTHWGQHGAAGLLMRYTDEAEEIQYYYLQWRPYWLNEGNCFSIPGGALKRRESPESGAWREAQEELGRIPVRSRLVAVFEDPHGGWSYYTVVQEVRRRFEPLGDGGREHVGGIWVTEEQMRHLPLHPDFESMLDTLMEVGY